MTIAYRFDGDRFQPLDWQPARALRWAAWRRDGASALLVGNGGSVLLFDGRRLQSLSAQTKQNLRGAAWSPDGSRALLAGNRGAVLLLRGESLQELAAPTGENLRRVAWHTSGEFALIVGNAGTVLRYDARDGSLLPLAGDRAHTLRSLAWRPDGSYALVGAYASRWGGYPRPHAVYSCDGRYLRAALSSDDEDDIVSVDWSGAGLALLCGYALRPDGAAINKVLLYDGSAWRSHLWSSTAVILGGSWRPGHDQALLVGENGLALVAGPDGSIEELESGIKENLTGPFWQPDGSAALVLKGPDEKVYTV